jgi:TPR repeat protein
LELAAKDGSKAAMYDLYERLDDPEASMAWLKRAADDGSFRAMRQMYRVTCADDPQSAIAWLRKAAEAGDFGSRIALGCLERGEPVCFDIEQP